MKILFITDGKNADYQSDVLFHGLKTMYGKEVYETVDYRYMFDGISDDKRSLIYGKGFSLYGLLPSELQNIIPETVVKKLVRENYFDYVIYGSIWRCYRYFRLIKKYYPKEKIIFIDGEDRARIQKFFLNKGIYFKRESAQKLPNMFPVCFGIPRSKIVGAVPEKSMFKAFIIPGDFSTYIYNKESDYYKGYQTAWFGITGKKAGWDCLRHYEIMANGCIPYFIDLQNCPEDTLFLFPKQLILTANRLFEEQCRDEQKLKSVAGEVLEWTRNHLTTEQIAAYVIDTAMQVKRLEKAPSYWFSGEVRHFLRKTMNNEQ